MNITEQAIIEYLKNRVSETGKKGLTISASSDETRFAVSMPISPSSYLRVYGFGQSIDDALADLSTKYRTPSERAEALRAQAAELEKEAMQ